MSRVRIKSNSDPLHVVVDSMPAGGAGLTDTELRASPVVVDLGANNDVTVTGNVAVTGTFFQAAQPITDNGGSLTVDGTFFQATQPISGTVTANAGTGPWPITDNAGSLTVDGTVTVTDGSGSLTVDGTVAATQSGTWNIGSITTLPALVAGTANIGDVDVLTLPSIPAGNNNIGDVDIATIAAGNNNIGDVDVASIAAGNNNIGDVDVASIAAGTNRIGSVRVVDSADADLTSVVGTQTSRYLGVQNSTDAGRTEVRFYAIAAAAGTTGTETAITLTRSSGTAATATGTSFVLTTGKRLRLTHISVATRGNATGTIQTTTFNFRINTAGAVVVGSTPVILACRSACAAVNSAWDRYVLDLGEGMEILGNGTIQFGVTAAATYVTNAPTWDVTILGYEY